MNEKKLTLQLQSSGLYVHVKNDRIDTRVSVYTIGNYIQKYFETKNEKTTVNR